MQGAGHDDDTPTLTRSRGGSGRISFGAVSFGQSNETPRASTRLSTSGKRQRTPINHVLEEGDEPWIDVLDHQHHNGQTPQTVARVAAVDAQRSARISGGGSALATVAATPVGQSLSQVVWNNKHNDAAEEGTGRGSSELKQQLFPPTARRSAHHAAPVDPIEDSAVRAILSENPPTVTRAAQLRPGYTAPSPQTPLWSDETTAVWCSNRRRHTPDEDAEGLGGRSLCLLEDEDDGEAMRPLFGGEERGLLTQEAGRQEEQSQGLGHRLSRRATTATRSSASSSAMTQHDLQDWAERTRHFFEQIDKRPLIATAAGNKAQRDGEGEQHHHGAAQLSSELASFLRAPKGVGRASLSGSMAGVSPSPTMPTRSVSTRSEMRFGDMSPFEVMVAKAKEDAGIS